MIRLLLMWVFRKTNPYQVTYNTSPLTRTYQKEYDSTLDFQKQHLITLTTVWKNNRTKRTGINKNYTEDHSSHICIFLLNVLSADGRTEICLMNSNAITQCNTLNWKQKFVMHAEYLHWLNCKIVLKPTFCRLTIKTTWSKLK